MTNYSLKRSISDGSKVVQVKGFMPLSQHKTRKYRTAKPFGSMLLYNFIAKFQKVMS